MDIETRVTNLENLVNSLVELINDQKFYTDSDVAGCRHTEVALDNKIEEIKPYEAVEMASFGDTEVVFTGVPNGVATVDIKPLDGNVPAFHVSRDDDIVRVFFDEPLTYAADVRLIVN